jgi:hypothetical protein
MILSLGGDSITLRNPMWKYSVDYGMNIHTTRTASGKYRLFDCGATYDTITCTCTITDTIETMRTLEGLIRGIWRGATVSLDLGVSPTGFYPGGPQNGDLGTFSVTILSYEPTGWLQSPWGYVEAKVSLEVSAVPVYLYPDAVPEGDFSIGAISGLRWPDPGIKPTPEYGYGVEVTRDGTTYASDTGASRDIWTTEFTQPMNQENAGVMMAYLTGAGRGADITTTVPKNSYLFGTENAEPDGSGTYTMNLINGDESGTVLTWNHIRFNHWEIPLKFWMQNFLAA